MSSGSSRLGGRLDGQGGPTAWESLIPPHSLLGHDHGDSDAVSLAVASARDWLLDHQHVEGYWIGELEGDTILESEYILLLTWMGRGQSEIAQKCARTIVNEQLPTGGWALFPGGPLEISASVKAYWTLKITGHDPQAEYMVRAREAIRAAGGAEKVNSFTRFYFALLGIISYQQCPAVPPELMFLPSWMPFNIYEMSAWSRTIVVPLSLIWAFQPSIQLPPEHKIDELFLNGPANLPVTMPPSGQLDDLKAKSWVNWHKVFGAIDVSWKMLERLHIKPLRSWAIRKASKWMVDRFAKSDGLGAIFPPIIWSIISLRCLGYSEESPEVQTALKELEKLTIHEGETARLEPCRSPVWDTAISVIALREAGVSADSAPLRLAIDWLLSKEVRQPGDWSVRKPEIEPAGWYFEFNNEFYPDIDDTIMTTMALAKCLPGDSHAAWTAEFVPGDNKPRIASVADKVNTVVFGTTTSPGRAAADVDRMRPMLSAIERAVRWISAMQCRNGGWAAFDADNDRELFTRVPFADHNAMIDPPTADITARTLEMYGRLGVGRHHPTLERAINYVWSDQQPDNAWYGRWGVNYIYGTWQVLVGLTAIGIPGSDPRLQAGANWLRRMQQSSGGWGETPLSYDQPELRGTGTPTPSQTAWALMGLMAVGDFDSEAVQRGVQYLLNTQREDGTWDEPEFTGTGFPRVFYLRYHLYRHYWPLMALGRYRTLRQA
jgi:squalene-hopene/tetraprenyl-beta-curcumene cyclase